MKNVNCPSLQDLIDDQLWTVPVGGRAVVAIKAVREGQLTGSLRLHPPPNLLAALQALPCTTQDLIVEVVEHRHGSTLVRIPCLGTHAIHELWGTLAVLRPRQEVK
jgi:hypothetical protein